MSNKNNADFRFTIEEGVKDAIGTHPLEGYDLVSAAGMLGLRPDDVLPGGAYRQRLEQLLKRS